MKMAHPINNVPGTLVRGKCAELILTQHWESEFRTYDKGRRRLRAELRFDDSCKNGYMNFGITATGHRKMSNNCWTEDIGGCCHEEIAEVFPELEELIQWHDYSTKGLSSGVANAVYHAGNRDYNGLLKGERRQIRNERTGKLAWRLEAVRDENATIKESYQKDVEGCETVSLNALENTYAGEANELPTPSLEWVPWCHVGDGKARDFKAARNYFPGFELTDEILSLEKLELAAILEKLIPRIVANFQQVMLGSGFKWVVASK